MMRFQVLTGQMLREEDNLLDTARYLIRADAMIEDVHRELKRLSQMDECRVALNRCRVDLRLASSNLLRLSTSLNDITTIYARTEAANRDQMEGGHDFRILRERGSFHNNSAAIHQQIEDILRK